VKRLAAINVPHQALFDRALRENPNQGAASQYMFAFRGPHGEAIVSENDFGVLRALYEPLVQRGVVTREDYEGHIAALKKPGALTAGLNWYRACEIGPPDAASGHPGGSNVLDGVPPEAMIVKAPVLLVLGDKDPYVLAEIADGIERYAPNVTVKRLAEGGHFLTLEHPDFVLPHLHTFFSAP
jgi:epoxide hydrolase 4